MRGKREGVRERVSCRVGAGRRERERPGRTGRRKGPEWREGGRELGL